MSDVRPSVRDVIIIGSGPAGLTAAVYTARANLAPLLIEGEPSSTSDQPGGQLMLTTEVENYPGFPEGIMGPDLMQEMRDQAVRFGTEIITEKVTKVDFSERPYKVWVRDTLYLANAVIVSTGAQSLMLGLEAEERLIGHGLSTCATCDGFFFRGHEIAVVGGGDSGDRRGDVPHQVRRQGHDRAPARRTPCLQDHAGPCVRQPEDRVRLEQPGHRDHGRPVRHRDRAREHGDRRTEHARRHGSVRRDRAPSRTRTCSSANSTWSPTRGYLITAHGSSFTNVEGVFACGDVQDHTYRQAITAAGSGCMAAIDAERWLEANIHHAL